MNLDRLVKQISGLLPPGTEVLRSDLDRNLRRAVGAALEQMDLVTREEFDIQVAVLERTREKLELLETRVRELEARLDAPDSRKSDG